MNKGHREVMSRAAPRRFTSTSACRLTVKFDELIKL
jgi:hypothetical protein